MTPPLTTTTPGWPVPSTSRPRLEFDAAGTGGVWRPRGNDLVTELPDVLTALGVRIGPIHRVTYHLDEWTTPPRKLANGGRQVRLDGYRHKPAHTVDALGVSGDKLTLRVHFPFTDNGEMIAAQQCWDSEGGTVDTD
ncbi:hypothetical protein IU450_23285 [Nocardia abscessus]|uniref:DUF5994 family protein n=1 Tax=Nocardia abscessus TaxID=120957 RepID=UPI001894A987|nr:DUF5994 family protein [Nocardia abscessus]MBF6338795.1 hypothetical protein [Nocardia abscessus]